MKKTRTTPDAEMASGLDSMTISGTEALRSVEEGIISMNSGIWEIFHEHPNVGAVLSGGVGLGAAMAIGVAELVAAVAAGYLGYRIFAYGESFTEAIEKTIEFREGKLSKEEL